MYIAYNIKNGHEYATITSSVRDGKKVVKGESTNLGRVLDKERGIYRNRERGVFTFCLETGVYGPAPADFKEAPKRRRSCYIKNGRKKHSIFYLNIQIKDFIRRFSLSASFGEEYVNLISFFKKMRIKYIYCSNTVGDNKGKKEVPLL